MTGISTSFDNAHRHRMESGSWFRFARQDKSGASQSATASGPHLPSVECKIEKADENACNRQNRCGDIGIDKLIQVMEQKPALVRLDASLGFKPVLEHGQRAGPGEEFGEDSPDKRDDMKPAKDRTRPRQQGAENHP